MKSTAQQLIERGMAEGMSKGKAEGMSKGLSEGIAKGMAEGKAADVTRLLQHRFGALPQAVQSRIAAAPLNELERLFDQALDAPSLDAIFGPDPKRD